MATLKLKETDYGADLKYEFLNSGEHPLSKEDYGKLIKNGLKYNNPRDYYDDEYGDESWLLWGSKAQ